MKEEGRVAPCREVVDAAQDGKLVIVTSALTIAEVLNTKGQKPIPKNIRNQVDCFFKNGYINVRNVARSTSDKARDFVWGDLVKPKDAAHIATAMEVRAPVFHTFDEGLLKKNGVLGNPPLKIETPQVVAPELPLQGH